MTLGKTVLCHGCFDIFHIGHLYHLIKAKEYGDYLVVSITADRYINKGPGRPAFKQKDRKKLLSHIDIVDKVVISESSNAISVLETVSPDFFIKGSDYRDADSLNFSLEKNFCENNQIEIIYTDEQTNSSTVIYNEYFKS